MQILIHEIEYQQIEKRCLLSRFVTVAPQNPSRKSNFKQPDSFFLLITLNISPHMCDVNTNYNCNHIHFYFLSVFFANSLFYHQLLLFMDFLRQNANVTVNFSILFLMYYRKILLNFASTEKHVVNGERNIIFYPFLTCNFCLFMAFL